MSVALQEDHQLLVEAVRDFARAELLERDREYPYLHLRQIRQANHAMQRVAPPHLVEQSECPRRVPC